MIGTKTGTPQGGILSPLLANIALSVLDEYFVEAWETMMATSHDRATTPTPRTNPTTASSVCGRLRGAGVGNQGACRGTEQRGGGGARTDGPSPVGGKDHDCPYRRGVRLPRLPHPAAEAREDRTRVFVYTWPSKKALASIMAKVRAITKQGTNSPLSDLLRRLNLALRGWTTYFRHGVSKATFGYLSHYTWLRVIRWLRRKHPPCDLEGRCDAATSLTGGGPSRSVDALQLRHGAGDALSLPGNEDSVAMGRADRWPRHGNAWRSWRAGCDGSRTSGSGSGPEKRISRNAGTALRLDSTVWGNESGARNASFLGAVATLRVESQKGGRGTAGSGVDLSDAAERLDR